MRGTTGPANNSGCGPFDVPIEGTIDLHTFRPDELKSLLEEYLFECRKRDILQVRVVHGKGSGTLRERVHTLLARMPGIESFSLAGDDAGGWGATIVILRPLTNGA